MVIQWTPSHCGVFPNHYVDVVAKAFLAREPSAPYSAPLPRQTWLAQYGVTLSDGTLSWAAGERRLLSLAQANLAQYGLRRAIDAAAHDVGELILHLPTLLPQAWPWQSAWTNLLVALSRSKIGGGSKLKATPLGAVMRVRSAQLGLGETEWDMCLVQAAPRAAIVATALTQQWMDDYIAEAERLESRVRDVRANPRTNRATEPNVQSDDRKLRAHREVRLPGEGSSSASDRLQEFAQRSRAWVYYDIADAPPLLAADVTMADVPQLPASAAPMPTGRVTESGIVMMRLRDAMDAMDAMGSGGRSRGRGKGGGKGGNR